MSFKDLWNRITDKKEEPNEIRPGLKAPVIGFDRKGHPSHKYYMDLSGERDYEKNPRIKRVTPSK